MVSVPNTDISFLVDVEFKTSELRAELSYISCSLGMCVYVLGYACIEPTRKLSLDGPSTVWDIMDLIFLNRKCY